MVGKIKQHLVLKRGQKVIKEKSFFRKAEYLQGYFVKKAINFPANAFYSLNELDELNDMGITYEVVA